jgi:CheY-like chemotaxis protein
MSRTTRRSVETIGAAAKVPPRSRILLVDDDERNLLALSEVLAGIADIETATSGRDALRALLKGEFAVILLDVFMPGLDGYETAQMIRDRKQTSRIPIIFLSAVNKETEHLLRGYAMGAVDYVFKPVDALVLKSKVSVFVDLHNMRTQIEEKNRIEQALRDEKHLAELERLQAQKQLEVTLQRQAAILQVLPVALYEERPGDSGLPRRKFVGGDIRALTGLDPLDLEADETFFVSRIHPEDRARILSDARSRQPAQRLEYRWLFPDGSLRYFLDQRADVAFDGSSSVVAGTLLDITSRKELEGQLLQTGKLEAIGQLTGGIAHDFNNLLASILGGVNLLSSRVDLTERDARIIELMRHAAQQGVDLVRRMMAFARKQDLSPTVFTVHELTEAVAGLTEHALGGTVRLIVDIPEAVTFVFADRSQLELALVNLVINSRDAMPHGGEIKLTIDTQAFADYRADLGLAAGEFVRLAVADTGEGMPPEQVAKAVEPFFTTKELGKGTGLGLSIVSGFVGQSGGALRIDSKVGEGTLVEIYLPKHLIASQETEAGLDKSSAIRVQSVLLVDDDDTIREILAEQLLEHGIAVTSVADGAQALHRLRQKDAVFDLLLTDFAMPGMNGVELIDQSQAMAPDLRAVLMTGYADEEVLAKLDPAISVLFKPISHEALIAELGVKSGRA